MRRWALAGVLLLAGAAAAGETSAAIEQEVFTRVNQARREHGLKALIWDERIAEVARAHSRRMAEKHFFAHEDPEFGAIGERLDRAHIEWGRCAENIFEERGLDGPARAAVRGWMSSKGHREAILTSEFVRTGVGVYIAANGAIDFTQEFTGPARVAAPPQR